MVIGRALSPPFLHPLPLSSISSIPNCLAPNSLGKGKRRGGRHTADPPPPAETDAHSQVGSPPGNHVDTSLVSKHASQDANKEPAAKSRRASSPSSNQMDNVFNATAQVTKGGEYAADAAGPMLWFSRAGKQQLDPSRTWGASIRLPSVGGFVTLVSLLLTSPPTASTSFTSPSPLLPKLNSLHPAANPPVRCLNTGSTRLLSGPYSPR